MKRMIVLAAVALFAACADAAFAPNPKAAFKALGGVSGKPFKSGLVFIEGKYIPPPYKVERYGLVLRINKIQVTGPVVPWEEFIKTQAGVKVTKTQSGPDPAEVAEDEPEPEPEEEDLSFDDDDPLSDLFDDEPSVKKPSKKKSVRKPKPRKPVVKTVYTFDGEFVHNDTTKALLEKINQARTDIDKQLRNGGFVCFGSDYSRVTGDAGTVEILLDKLPGLMRNSNDLKTFAKGVRASGLTFFPGALCRDLFQNRVDYIKLMERQKAAKEEKEMNELLKGRKY